MTSVVTGKATGRRTNILFVRLLKGHALEQRHHPEGLRGLHQEASAGAAEGQGAREPAEEAGARQPTPDAEDTGKCVFMPFGFGSCWSFTVFMEQSLPLVAPLQLYLIPAVDITDDII